MARILSQFNFKLIATLYCVVETIFQVDNKAKYFSNKNNKNSEMRQVT